MMVKDRLAGSARQIADDIKEMFDRIPDDKKTPADKTAVDTTKVEIREIIGKK